MNPNGRFKALQRPAKFVLVGAAVSFIAAFAMKDRLPARATILPELLQEPAQTKDDLPAPFDVTRKGVTYTVEPLFNYELWGMVVSYHHANSLTDISHEAWKDYINVKDVCVLWGKNLETAVYERMKFRNRDFTCFYTYPDEETGRVFSENCLANNHLLPADPIVAAAVMRARKGDQVHFKGWLVSYGIKDSPYRRTSSTTRFDRGNGACETVFINEFQVLRPANSSWRALSKLSLVLMALSAAVLVFGGFSPRPAGDDSL